MQVMVEDGDDAYKKELTMQEGIHLPSHTQLLLYVHFVLRN